MELAECDHLANQVRNLLLIFPELDDVTYAMNNLLVLALCLCTQLVRLVFDRWSPNDFSKSPISRHIPPSPWDVGIPSENLSCVLIPFQLSVHAKRDTFLLRHLHGFYRRERHRLLCYVAIWHLPLMIGIWGGDLGRSTAWSGPFRHCTPGWVALNMVYVKYLGWNKGYKNGLFDHRRDWDRTIAIDNEKIFVGRGLVLEFGHGKWSGNLGLCEEKFVNRRLRDLNHTYESTDLDNLIERKVFLLLILPYS